MKIIEMRLFSKLFLKHKSQIVPKLQKHYTTSVKPFTLIGCGNPLLDIIARVDPTLLTKYELKSNRAYLAEAKHKTLYDELIRDYQVDYTAGGAAQNSLRVCQWILQKPYSTVFIGSVGNDEYAQILERNASKDGVKTQYQRKDNLPTGTCAVLVTGADRTLVANLSAAESFTIDYLRSPTLKCLIENAQYFYTTGFFLTVCLACILEIAQHAHCHNKPFIFNLSASYISQQYMDSLLTIMPYVDILFGNEYEMEAFAKVNQWNLNKDRKEIGRKIQSFAKVNQKRPRIVIITQGPSAVLVIQDHSVKELDVPHLPFEVIVDTNGAGDAFVGGFLSQLLQEEDLDVCLKCGIYAAQHIILQSGCTFSGKPEFKANS